MTRKPPPEDLGRVRFVIVCVSTVTRIRTGGGLLWAFGFHEWWSVSWQARFLSASLELCPMGLVYIWVSKWHIYSAKWRINCRLIGSCVMNTNRITPWSRALLERLMVTQMIGNFPAFYVIRGIIGVFTRARQLRDPL